MMMRLVLLLLQSLPQVQGQRETSGEDVRTITTQIPREEGRCLRYFNRSDIDLILANRGDGKRKSNLEDECDKVRDQWRLSFR